VRATSRIEPCFYTIYAKSGRPSIAEVSLGLKNESGSDGTSACRKTWSMWSTLIKLTFFRTCCGMSEMSFSFSGDEDRLDAAAMSR
jgi:hypothetical protein